MKGMGATTFSHDRLHASSSSTVFFPRALVMLFVVFLVSWQPTTAFKTIPTTKNYLNSYSNLMRQSQIRDGDNVPFVSSSQTAHTPWTTPGPTKVAACQTSASSPEKCRQTKQSTVDMFSSSSSTSSSSSSDSSSSASGVGKEDTLRTKKHVKFQTGDYGNPRQEDKRTSGGGVVKSSKSARKVAKVKKDKVVDKGSQVSPPPVPPSLQHLSHWTTENIADMEKYLRKKRHYCKLRRFESFTCKKLEGSLWLTKALNKNVTRLNGWLEIVRNGAKKDNSSGDGVVVDAAQNLCWPEKIIYRLINAWGDPEDFFVFHKYKDFVRSSELTISLPYEVQLKVAPNHPQENASARAVVSSTSLAGDTARFFWDPGFNLKLKLPFFRDELKVAVSTGPSFVAGIGVGIAVLIIKSMFAPMLFGLKWMLYNVFFKESSPFELMKMFVLSHTAPEPWESAVPPPAVEHYRPPPMHNPFDNRGPPYLGGRGPRPPPPLRHHPPFRPPYKGYGPPHHFASPTMSGPTYSELDYSPPLQNPYDLKHQYTEGSPVLADVNPTMSQLEQMYRAQLLEDGLGFKHPTYKSLMSPDPTNTIEGTGPDGAVMEAMDIGMETDPQDGSSYIPSNGLQAEVEHFDPFYSPLLSKIDSIFMHLGHQDEGCRERVVCSIYKFPVKYAPYSNLLSAQLSKHQSELKRPVSSSPKILRYFRYMKAAKDGQSGENCVDLYPKCESDTDTVSSLPMITTFHQLSELMTAEPSSPGGAHK